MTVRIERSFDFSVEPTRVWAFISDPAKRAGAISVVERFDIRSDGSATWQVRLPLPLVDSTVAVETEETARDPPRQVKFVGHSRVFRVVGEHRIEPTDAGCRLENTFQVDGRLPGVERFFSRNLDDELDNLERALRVDLDLDP